ncbi:MAG: PD40 domain-containing protein, partial [Actinobacteria bacterium]|nr:PD40 domain-containing protein [Actinomycetota bacterium]
MTLVVPTLLSVGTIGGIPAGAAGTTQQISVTLTGGGNTWSMAPAVSDDVRYVAFESWSDDLIAGDTNDMWDVFVYDRNTSTLELVSVSSAEGPGENDSRAAAISADGRYVAFSSTADNLVTLPETDTNLRSDIFVRDRVAGTTTRVSTSSLGVQADDGSSAPAISADGRYVAFESDATVLVTGDTNDVRDVFVKDTQTGTVTRVSVPTGGSQGNGESTLPAISADGRHVVFESDATNLVSGDTNLSRDVFRHDRQTGTTVRVSEPWDGVALMGDSERAAIDETGRYVAFQSEAQNMVPGSDTAAADIFVRDMQTGTNSRVSDTGGSDGWDFYPAISRDGRYVAFRSKSTNLVAGDTNAQDDVFVRDTVAGTTIRASVASDGTQGNYLTTMPALGD